MNPKFFPRMRQIQGAIIVASLFQLVIGYFGIIGLILRFITPLTIAPAVSMVGLALFEVAGSYAAGHWGIAIGMIVNDNVRQPFTRSKNFKFRISFTF